MIEIESGSGFEAITTSCFQLRFLWNADHWQQEIVSADRYASIPRIWSVEGNQTFTDPTRVGGPIYQQIHLDRDEQGRGRALLVGQSGPHHFSAAFVVEDFEHRSQIAVDVADRCHAPIEALAATYLIETSSADLDTDGDLARLTWKYPTSQLTFEAVPPARLSVSEASYGSIRIQALAALDASHKTQRFQYLWKWSEAPELRP